MSNSNNADFSSILTHFDLDGVASAALCSYIYDIDNIFFTGPANVELQEIDEGTIVCDLPYPRACGLWFDHHIANRDELALRNIRAHELPGRLENKPSCLRVIYDYFVDEYDIDHWMPLVKEVDRIDDFQFRSVKDWRQESPGRILESAIKQEWSSSAFLRDLALRLRDRDYTRVAQEEDVDEKARAFRKSEGTQIDIFRRSATFLDENQNVVWIDLTGLQNPPTLQKALAYLVYPQANAVLETRCQYEGEKKTNNVSFSMSLGFVEPTLKARIDIGDMMRRLNIGGGHPGAAAGLVRCESKAAREKQMAATLEKIKGLWQKQIESGGDHGKGNQNPQAG